LKHQQGQELEEIFSDWQLSQEILSAPPNYFLTKGGGGCVLWISWTRSYSFDAGIL